MSIAEAAKKLNRDYKQSLKTKDELLEERLQKIEEDIKKLNENIELIVRLIERN